MGHDQCIFCKILKNELEASFVYKGNIVSAFLDINPVNEGHVLVVPNIHCERFTGLSPDTVKEMFFIGQKILKAIEDSKIACEGANLFLSDGSVAGQEVLHSHLHIAPRFYGDKHKMGFSHVDTSEKDREDLNNTAKTIVNKLSQNNIDSN